MGLQVAYHLLKIRGLLTLSNTCTVALPDLYFHWPRQAVASFVFRARGIVCVESSIVSFSNHRPCLESY